MTTTLIDLVDNTKTDKNTIHSYLDLYHKLLESKRDSAKNVLEIGILKGGSIKLWHDYFLNAQIYGLDIIHEKDVWEEIKNKDRIHLYTETDAYNETFVQNEFVDNSLSFDFILDDGPHTLESMVKCIELYTPLLSQKGLLVIEDIQKPEWINTLANTVPDYLKKYIKVYDLRQNKGRYDDLVFSIDKRNYKE